VQAKGLVRRLACPLNCPFVPRQATKRRAVPLRLGTLWARHKVDMTVQVRALSVPRTYATGDRLALLAWSTAQELLAHPAGKHSRALERVKLPAAVSLPVVVEAPLAGEGRWRRRPTTPSDSAPISLHPQSISTRWRYQRDGSGLWSGGLTVDDMTTSVWPNGRQVREPAGHGINFPQATESGNLKSTGMRLFSSPKVTSRG